MVSAERAVTESDPNKTEAVIFGTHQRLPCLINAAFTPDTCSPNTSCIHLYPRIERCLELISGYMYLVTLV